MGPSRVYITQADRYVSAHYYHFVYGGLLRKGSEIVFYFILGGLNKRWYSGIRAGDNLRATLSDDRESGLGT